MTSKQVMLLSMVALVFFSGCSLLKDRPVVETFPSPYDVHQVWAVAPLRNESGSLEPDGIVMADKLAAQLEHATNVDVIPVNRVLAAMQAIELAELKSPGDVTRLMRTLHVDAMVIGTITAYDPYDPPKVGLQIELHLNGVTAVKQAVNIRRLTGAATNEATLLEQTLIRNPVSIASDMLDASNPQTREKLRHYGTDRGGHKPLEKPWWHHAATNTGVLERDDAGWHLYRINMDLYTEFVSYEMSRQLLEAETQRLPKVTAQPTIPTP